MPMNRLGRGLRLSASRPPVCVFGTSRGFSARQSENRCCKVWKYRASDYRVGQVTVVITQLAVPARGLRKAQTKNHPQLSTRASPRLLLRVKTSPPSRGKKNVNQMRGVAVIWVRVSLTRTWRLMPKGQLLVCFRVGRSTTPSGIHCAFTPTPLSWSPFVIIGKINPFSS